MSDTETSIQRWRIEVTCTFTKRDDDDPMSATEHIQALQSNLKANVRGHFGGAAVSMGQSGSLNTVTFVFIDVDKRDLSAKMPDIRWRITHALYGDHYKSPPPEVQWRFSNLET